MNESGYKIYFWKIRFCNPSLAVKNLDFTNYPSESREIESERERGRKRELDIYIHIYREREMHEIQIIQYSECLVEASLPRPPGSSQQQFPGQPEYTAKIWNKCIASYG